VSEVRLSGYRISGLQGRVITQIGRAIVSGRFQPGELLPREADLLAEFGGSRPSLREALKVLAAKGLIEMRQKVGTRVRARDLWNMFDSDVLAWHRGPALDGHPVGDAVLRDLIELRQMIEPATARLAATRATTEDLRRIGHAVDAMQAHTRDLARYSEADVEFHMAVFSASHNVLLASFAHIVGDFLKLSFRIQQESYTDDDKGAQDNVITHRAVFTAISHGDGEAAHLAMLEVVLTGKDSLLAAIDTTAATPKRA
jgi:DNA-binding FadR family transcriptional regulator